MEDNGIGHIHPIWALAILIVIVLVLLCAFSVQSHSRNDGVTVSNWHHNGNRLTVYVDIYERCESGSYEVTAHWTTHRSGFDRETEARGHWRNGASSSSVRLHIPRGVDIHHVSVTAVWSDCE